MSDSPRISSYYTDPQVIAGVSIDGTLAAHNRELVSPEIVELRKAIENLQSQVAVLNSHTGINQ